MNRGRCEERACGSGARSPERESADTVEKHVVDVPPGFDTVVEVGVIALAQVGKKASARSCGWGGHGLRGKCGEAAFFLVYTLMPRAPGAEAALGERLANHGKADRCQTTTTVNGSSIRRQIDRMPGLHERQSPGVVGECLIVLPPTSVIVGGCRLGLFVKGVGIARPNRQHSPRLCREGRKAGSSGSAFTLAPRRKVRGCTAPVWPRGDQATARQALLSSVCGRGRNSRSP
jgi:hypothetical protein